MSLIYVSSDDDDDSQPFNGVSSSGSTVYIEGVSHDLSSLRPKTWIRTDVIDLFFEKLNKYYETNVPSRRILFSRTSAWETYNIGQTARFDNIRIPEVALVPINDNNTHWFLMKIDFITERVTFIDTSGGQDTTVTSTMNKNYDKAMHFVHSVTGSIRKPYFETSIDRSLQQNDNFSCGIYVMGNALHLAAVGGLRKIRPEMLRPHIDDFLRGGSDDPSSLLVHTSRCNDCSKRRKLSRKK